MNILNLKTTLSIALAVFYSLIFVNDAAAQQLITGTAGSNIDLTKTFAIGGGTNDAIKLNGATLLYRGGDDINFASRSTTDAKLNLYSPNNQFRGGLWTQLGGGNNFVSLVDKSGNRVFGSKLNSWSSLCVSGNRYVTAFSDGRVAIADNDHTILKDKDNNQITNYRLFVQTGILTEKVKVAIAGETDWADYVFEEDYEMLPLDELEDFVTENKHLPKVPSAEEMVENGLDVAKMDAKLLEKIEEAYLYIIDLNKKVDALANENESLKTSLQSISTSGK